MIQRGGKVVFRMLADVRKATIEPLLKASVAPGCMIYTNEYVIYTTIWNNGDCCHESLNHGAGKYARGDDGDGFCEVHVNTMQGFYSLLRSWLRPHRGVSQAKLPQALNILSADSEIRSHFDLQPSEFHNFFWNHQKKGGIVAETMIKALPH